MSLLTRPPLRTSILLLPPAIRTALYAPRARQFHASASHNSPLDTAHSLFLSLHDIGHTWALAVPLAAITVRLGLLTVLIPARTSMQRRMQIAPLITGFRSAQRQETGTIIKMGGMQDLRQHSKEYDSKFEEYKKWLRKDWRAGRFWQFASWVQLPLFLGMAECMRSMLGMHRGILAMISSSIFGDPDATPATLDNLEKPVFHAEWIEPSMTTEGLPWFQDLTVADPTLTLPFMVSGLMFANIYFSGGKALASQQKPWQRGLKRGLLGVALLIGPMTLGLPAGILYYWACSSATSFASNMLIDRIWPLQRPVLACKRPLRVEGGS
jgi:inner membrane protein COX18